MVNVFLRVLEMNEVSNEQCRRHQEQLKDAQTVRKLRDRQSQSVRVQRVTCFSEVYHLHWSQAFSVSRASLVLCFIGPYEILDRVVTSTILFTLSPYPFDQIREIYLIREEPESIRRPSDRVHEEHDIPFVKILWNNHPGGKPHGRRGSNTTSLSSFSSIFWRSLLMLTLLLHSVSLERYAQPYFLSLSYYDRPKTLGEAFALARITEARFEDERATIVIAKPNDLNIAVQVQDIEETTLHTSDKVEAVSTSMVATYEEHECQDGFCMVATYEEQECQDGLKPVTTRSFAGKKGDLCAITSKGGPPDHMRASEKELVVLKSPLEQKSMFRRQERMLRRQEQQQLAKDAKIQIRI
ncbi:hypothetical protein Tco_0682931 [Tanacetum coccineum]|uniref:Uncharacterized protein n=1 Tax=Tanacetum coccineum TaxID=301880 RepID=A0ABQ4XT73_9ASTR